ncbi:hypothetical protein RB195_011448 [Necator americanus]|uniref:Uncharacterized protein n=1 Tax=Necator americanus TaxID=51031 RepID=A0ABR1D5P2_NECAM
MTIMVSANKAINAKLIIEWLGTGETNKLLSGKVHSYEITVGSIQMHTSAANKREPKNIDDVDTEELRTAHACISESDLTTAKDFVIINLSKEGPIEVEKALKDAEQDTTPLIDAKPSHSESQMKQVQDLVKYEIFAKRD